MRIRPRVWGRAIVAIVATAIATACGGPPPRTPAGQPPIVTLAPATLGALEERFNLADDRTRVLVLLSPT